MLQVSYQPAVFHDYTDFEADKNPFLFIVMVPEPFGGRLHEIVSQIPVAILLTNTVSVFDIPVVIPLTQHDSSLVKWISNLRT